MELENRNDIYSEIKNLLENARGKVLSAINSTMTMTYYLIGKRIVEEEQKGDKNYGKYIVENLSNKLSEEFGKNFSKRNIYLMIKFYQVYSQNEIVKSLISQSQNPFKLSWTHYIRLVRIENGEERRFYQIEAEKENWTVREMDRQINSCLYDRLVKLPDENKTIGIIICRDKNDTLIEITLPENNEQIFASKYLTILPTKEELKRIVEEEENNE